MKKQANLDKNLMGEIAKAREAGRKFSNPADKFVNQPGHWTMAKEYPHNCIHCGKGYNQHNPWPELPCPDPTKEEREARIRLAALDLLDAVKQMQKACDEWAAEFTEKKRAMDWGIVNDAYTAATRAIAKAEGR